MKVKKFESLAYLVVIALLFGCSDSSNPGLGTPTPTNRQHITTVTPIISNPLPVATISPTVANIPVCRGARKHILASSESGISGTIIYQNEDHSGLYTIGGTPIGRSQLLDNESQRNLVFGFSPDGQWLGYSPLRTNNNAKYEELKMVLLSAQGKKIENVLSTKEFEKEITVGTQLMGVSGYSHWINNQLIYVTLYTQASAPGTSGTLEDLPKVLHSFDGEWNNYFLDLPERFLSQVVGISPDKSRALYDEKGLSLWDYDRKTRIWHDDILISPNRALIMWSPDSSIVAYANLYDVSDERPSVLLISRDGDHQLIIMDKTSPVPELGILRISWSPDSRYLALASLDHENLNILIYDIFLEKYISQCPVASFSDIWPSIIWSPDSSHIAISQNDSPILILNALTGDILELAQHGRILGWSNKFPVVLP